MILLYENLQVGMSFNASDSKVEILEINNLTVTYRMDGDHHIWKAQRPKDMFASSATDVKYREKRTILLGDLV